jgi:hypothetical protein
MSSAIMNKATKTFYGGKKEVNVLNLQHPVVVNTSSIKKNQCLKQISVGKAG